MEVQDVEKARMAYLTPLFLKWARKGVHQFEWHFTEEVGVPVAGAF
jgi:hypothetical protein